MVDCKDGSCAVGDACGHESLKFVSAEYMLCNMCGKSFKSEAFKKQE